MTTQINTTENSLSHIAAPKSRGHAMPPGPHGKHQGLVKRQREREEIMAQEFIMFSMEGRGQPGEVNGSQCRIEPLQWALWYRGGVCVSGTWLWADLGKYWLDG